MKLSEEINGHKFSQVSKMRIIFQSTTDAECARGMMGWMPVISMDTDIGNKVDLKCQPVHENSEINLHQRQFLRKKGVTHPKK